MCKRSDLLKEHNGENSFQNIRAFHKELRNKKYLYAAAIFFHSAAAVVQCYGKRSGLFPVVGIHDQ